MERKDITDDEFPVQFAALSSGGDMPAQKVKLSQNAVKHREWNKCILVKIFSSNVIHEAVFADNISNWWSVHPTTKFEALGFNFFLIQCVYEEEMYHILDKGICNFKGDMMVTRQAHGPVDETNPIMKHMECWVHLHGVPSHLLTAEGIQNLMMNIGKPISGMQIKLIGGQKVYKQKLRVHMENSLIDKLSFENPEGGDIEMKVVYEGVTMLCMFCALIRHQHSRCPDRLRLLRLQHEGKYPSDKEIPDCMVGQWINNKNYFEEA